MAIFEREFQLASRRDVSKVAEGADFVRGSNRYGSPLLNIRTYQRKVLDHSPGTRFPGIHEIGVFVKPVFLAHITETADSPSVLLIRKSS